MSWERLRRQLAMGQESEFDFVVDGEEIRNTRAVSGRERVQNLRRWIEELIAGQGQSRGLRAELEAWHSELVDVIEELDGFQDRTAAELFQEKFGAIADAIGVLADSLGATNDYAVLLGPLAVLESAVEDFDRALSEQLAREEPQPAEREGDLS